MVQLQMNCVCVPLLSSRFHLGMCALKIISNLIEERYDRNFGALVRSANVSECVCECQNALRNCPNTFVWWFGKCH